MSTRAALVTAGVLLAAGGAVAMVAGGAVVVVVGHDNALSTGSHRTSTSTTALVTPIDNVSDRGVDTLGRPTLRTTLRRAAEPVFVGVGPAKQVDAYLAGAAIETVDDFEVDPYDLDTTTRAGSTRPAAPDTQSFWVARSDGASGADLSWRMRGGDYRLVVMNADGSPGVAADARVSITVPHLFAIGGIVLGLGLTVLAIGAGMAVVGVAVTRPGDSTVAGAFPAPRPGWVPPGPVAAPVEVPAERPETQPVGQPGGRPQD
jgi:hypothetical protein